MTYEDARARIYHELDLVYRKLHPIDRPLTPEQARIWRAIKEVFEPEQHTQPKEREGATHAQTDEPGRDLREELYQILCEMRRAAAESEEDAEAPHSTADDLLVKAARLCGVPGSILEAYKAVEKWFALAYLVPAHPII